MLGHYCSHFKRYLTSLWGSNLWCGRGWAGGYIRKNGVNQEFSVSLSTDSTKCWGTIASILNDISPTYGVQTSGGGPILTTCPFLVTTLVVYYWYFLYSSRYYFSILGNFLGGGGGGGVRGCIFYVLKNLKVYLKIVI